MCCCLLFRILNSLGTIKRSEKLKLPLKEAKHFSVSGAFSDQGNKSMCAGRGVVFPALN